MQLFWQMVFLPLVLLVLLTCTIPFTLAVKRWLKDGRLKRFLLWVPPWHRERATRRAKSL
jgi:hypothetical protein